MAELMAIFSLGFTLVGIIWFLVTAFQESFYWGMGCLLFAPVYLLFLFNHWKEAKGPFYILILAAICYGISTNLFEARMSG